MSIGKATVRKHDPCDAVKEATAHDIIVEVMKLHGELNVEKQQDQAFGAFLAAKRIAGVYGISFKELTNCEA